MRLAIRSLGLILCLAPLAQPRTAAAQGDVLELTPAVLDRVLVGAATEKVERDRLYASDPEVKAIADQQKCYDAATTDAARDRCIGADKPVAAKKKSPFESWQECVFANFPEAKKLSDQISAAAEKGDMATVQKLMPAAKELEPKAVAKCGPPPQQREEMEETQNPPGQSPEDMEKMQRIDEKMRTFDEQALAAAARAGKFTDRQYAIARERVIAFFKKQQEDGDGYSNYSGYKFSAAESRALQTYKAKLLAAFKRDF